MKTIQVIIEKTGTGYSGYTNGIPAISTGDTISELKSNITEAINLYLDETGGKEIKESEIKFSIDLSQFFEYFKEINASALGKRVGMSQPLLSQYINGQKKPSDKQTARILKGVKSLANELQSIEFSS